MTEPLEVGRVPRFCDVCMKFDAHPRHTNTLAPGDPGGVPDKATLDKIPKGISPSAIAELVDPTMTIRHFDCCASKGCQLCFEVTAATGGAHGDALLSTVEAGNVNHLGSVRGPNSDGED